MVAADESSEDDSSDSFDDDAVALARLVLAAAVWVVAVLRPSCQARTPPRESMLATLSAAAARRAFAARGLRLPGDRTGGVRGGGVREGVCSFMATNLRIAREGPARAG